jgi:hypothetical protein
MSEELGKDKKNGEEEEEEEEVEYVLLELGDCLYSDISPAAPFVLSVSCSFLDVQLCTINLFSTMFFDILARNNLLIFFRNYFLDFVCLLYI